MSIVQADNVKEALSKARRKHRNSVVTGAKKITGDRPKKTGPGKFWYRVKIKKRKKASKHNKVFKK